jgi:hypothetical protein
MAEAVASPIYFDFEAAKKSHEDSTLMLRVEMARQRLVALSPTRTDLVAARSELLGNLDSCHWSMENLRRLDKYVPDYAGLAGRTLLAAPGLYKQYNEDDLTKNDEKALGDLVGKAIGEVINGISNAYQASTERTAYQSAYVKARSAGKKVIAELCPNAYRSTNALGSIDLAIDVDGSWNNTFSADWVRMRNDSGRDLTDCTLFVSIDGTNATTGAAESDSHVHFLPRWPAGKWAYAPYPSRSAGGIATNESVDSIDKVKVAVFSEQATGSVEHTYAGAQFDADVERWVDSALKPKFSGQWCSYTNHTFYDNGFDFSVEAEFSPFPVQDVTVTLHEGTLETSLTWSLPGGTMSTGFLGKRYLSSSSFNAWDPDKVEVTLTFPKSGYKRVLTWNLK